MTVIKQTYIKVQRPNECLNENGNYPSFCGFLFHSCSASIKMTLMMLLKITRSYRKWAQLSQGSYPDSCSKGQITLLQNGYFCNQ